MATNISEGAYLFERIECIPQKIDVLSTSLDTKVKYYQGTVMKETPFNKSSEPVT